MYRIYVFMYRIVFFRGGFIPLSINKIMSVFESSDEKAHKKKEQYVF